MKKKEQRLKKLRRGRVWGGFAALLFVIIILSFALVFFVSSFIYYVLKTNLNSEYEKINYIAELYDKGTSDEQIRKIMNANVRDFVVKDKDGNILHQMGEDTMSGESGYAVLAINLIMSEDDLEKGGKPEQENSFKVDLYTAPLEDVGISYSVTSEADRMDEDENDDEDNDEADDTDTRIGTVNSITHVLIVTDAKAPYLYGVDENLWPKFKPLLRHMGQEAFDKGAQEVLLPYWIGLKADDGRSFYGKAFFKITMDDAAIMLVTVVFIMLMMLISFLILIFSLIGSIHKQRKFTAVLFMDEVTGGRNWIWFLTRVGAYLRRRRNDKYNFAIIDLVFVNYRNYCMCHSVAKGEELLTKVDILTKSMLNRKKEACAHYASANFGLLLKYENPEELAGRLKAMLERLEKVEETHNFRFHLGVNMLPAKTDGRGRLLRRKKINLDEEYNNACTARATLSDTDSSGIAYFDEKLVEEQKWLDIVQEEQKKALDNEEFRVYYQPKYNPVTNDLSGAEALIRWESPTYGFLSPGRFIPIFEKNGFITEIDHYMLKHVAKDQKRWKDEGRPCVPVSVNISRAHFVESNLAEQIRDMVDAEGTPHDLIELELTESAFFDDKNAIIRTIRKLKEYGFTVSMDDFGSGYSSLNSLKDMPLDVLKLDAEFFRGDNTGERGEIVVKEALKLAKALNMRTVAEGVEISEQVDFLASQGCDMIQGYIFAKPMPGEEYKDMMGHKGVQQTPGTAAAEK
ncbi:MAG: EAL domain-containing protein [Lachnospiraceae bacterium]|nr:EAL domain-containing protein [Lachnospiraceae bacterium]